MLHTHLHAQTKQRQFILLLSLPCALAPISTVQLGPFHAFTESFSQEDIQMIFNVLFFSKKCILLMGEAGCAQNKQQSYLKAAKRGKSDIGIFSMTQRALQPSKGLRGAGQWG